VWNFLYVVLRQADHLRFIQAWFVQFTAVLKLYDKGKEQWQNHT